MIFKKFQNKNKKKLRYCIYYGFLSKIRNCLSYFLSLSIWQNAKFWVF